MTIIRIPLIDKLEAHLRVEDRGYLTPCHVSTYKAAGSNGYTTLKLYTDKYRMAHRIAYEHYVGPIPEGHQIDHLCKVRACCNPDHLEAVTARENTLRSSTSGANAVRTNTCHKGHSLEGAYTFNGARTCSTCRNARLRIKRQVKVTA